MLFRSNQLPSKAQEYILHYGWLDPETKTYKFPFDHDRFINCSESPNVSGSGKEIFSIRDILPGEEITFPFDEDDLSINYR